MDALSANAIAAAVEVAGEHGIRSLSPMLLKDGSNAIIHLDPAPVAARVSTTSSWIRQPSEKWLQRDLDTASWLHARGAAVVAPSDQLPPGPHISSAETNSMAMTFWTFEAHDREHPATDAEAAAALPALHAALQEYPGHLPFLGVLLEELPHWLRWLEQRHALAGPDMIALRQAQWRMAEILLADRAPLQALHGDAHRGNLLRTPRGLLWTDFEDACSGPAAWDIATLLARDPKIAESTHAAYPDAPSWRELAPFLEARALEAVIYQQVLGQRFPERAPEAETALAKWHAQNSLLL